jgi:ABC-type multidrug transport system fused ATPase/permease subunit
VARPVELLGYAMQSLSQGIALLKRLLELFQHPTEPRQLAADYPLSGPGAVEFQNVSLAYRPDTMTLKDVSFTIPAGRTLGIVGTSGAGKSTIVRLLVRLVEPDRGRILLDGIAVAQCSLSRLREVVAVVPQDTVLFNDTIAYNIAFGRIGSSQQEVEDAAKLAHLHDFVMSLPDRYETIVGERGVKLSGGERQRVSIARAALKRPKIYVFDEATSSLDSKTEREILRNLREISRASTTLIIAHRLSTVVHADEIAVLEAGKIVERGTHASLLTTGGKYAALWRAQQTMTGGARHSPLPA